MKLLSLNHLFILLLLFFFNSSRCYAVKNDNANQKKWSVAHAESIQSEAVQKQFIKQLTKQRLNKSDSVSKYNSQINNNQNYIKKLTGFGSIPHSSDDSYNTNFKQIFPNVIAIHQKALGLNKRSKNQSSIQEMMNSLVVTNKASTSITTTINTYNALPASNSGWIYVYETATHDYLGFSSIDAQGQITYTATIGQSVDLIYYPNASSVEGIQVIENFVVAQSLTVTLERSYEYTVNLVDTDGQPLPNLSGKLTPILNIFFDFTGNTINIINGSGTVYLSETSSYHIKVAPTVPYLVSEVPANNGSTNSMADVVVKRGLTLDIDFNDSQNLIGVNGCNVEGSVEVFRSFDAENITNYQEKLDTSNKLIGFLVSVLDNEAVDITINFSANTGFCPLQDVKLVRHWYASTAHSLTVDLLPRPLPNFIFQDENNNPIPYSYGTVYELITNKAILFNSSFPPALIAGEMYAVSFNNTAYRLKSAVFTAQAGNFDISITSQLLTPIKSVITIDDASRINALVELYQSGELIEAFEYRGREITIEVPSGTYDVRVSGITAEKGTKAIVLKPFELSKTFTNTGSQRMDFALSIPTEGILFTIPYQDINLHLTFFEGVLPVATKIIYPGYSDGILTDFTTLNFQIRSSGFHDTNILATPSVALPVIDIMSSQETIGQLSGKVLDANNQPVKGVNVVMYFENGIASSIVAVTDINGSYSLPKLKNGLVQFLAPDNGASTLQQVPITNPSSNTSLDVVLPDVQFNATVENSTDLQLLYGTGQSSFQIVFLAESYTALSESFTDSNANGVWDGILYLDLNNNGIWDFGNGVYEPINAYGEKTIDYSNDPGTDVSAFNEAFVDTNSDGYPSINDYQVFIQNAKNYIRSLQGVPFIEQNIEFDVYVLFQASNQVGQDVIDENDVTVVTRDTLFNAQVSLSRSLLGIDYDLARQTLDAVAPNRDLTVVMINQPVFIGRANSYILANGGIGNSRPNSAVPGHEFGHNPGGLLDEYNEFDGTAKSYFSPNFHMSHTTNASEVEWYSDIGARFDLPVSVPYSFGNGVYAGGSLNAGGAYRSTSNSRMRNNAPDYNDISKTLLRKSFCNHNLVKEYFFGNANTSPNSDIIFVNGFEATATSGVIANPCHLP